MQATPLSLDRAAAGKQWIFSLFTNSSHLWPLSHRRVRRRGTQTLLWNIFICRCNNTSNSCFTRQLTTKKNHQNHY